MIGLVALATINPPVGAAEPATSASSELFAAARAVDENRLGGPVAACFDQIRAFACPIAASIPVVRDVVGFLSLELGFACPTRGVSTPTD